MRKNCAQLHQLNAKFPSIQTRPDLKSHHQYSCLVCRGKKVYRYTVAKPNDGTTQSLGYHSIASLFHTAKSQRQTDEWIKPPKDCESFLDV